MRFAVPFSFVRRCGDGTWRGGDWRTGALFFFAPSVVDEGTGRESERERGRERGTRGKMYQQPSGYEAAGQYDSKYAYDPEMGYGKTEEEGGYATFMEKQVRTDGPSCSRRRASPFLRLTRDPSHHLPSPYYFFSFSLLLLLVQVRQGFIRKVFSILAVQLLVTFSCAIGFASSAPLKAYVSQNMWPVYVAFPATFGKRHHPVPLSSFC